MSGVQSGVPIQDTGMLGQMAGAELVTGKVMDVLRGIRPLQANGLPYDAETPLADAGFASVEMVNVMLGIEAAFDVMIPQEMITPENFMDGRSIAALMQRVLPGG